MLLTKRRLERHSLRHSLKRMGMGVAVSAFKRLIVEEEKHIEFIKQILKDLREGKEINNNQA